MGANLSRLGKKEEEAINVLEEHNKTIDQLILQQQLLNGISKEYPQILEKTIESVNPFLDDELIKQLSQEDVKGISTIGNAIPGTHPTFIIQYKNLMEKIDSKNWWAKLKSENKIDWNTQKQNNKQFNLNRPLRIKIFLKYDLR